MEPALDVINRALQGDSGARSFLERTSSIYVLDVNDTANPKTYGCWNFIHQAMNEVERYEAAAGGGGANNSNGGKNGSSRSGDLVGHARILASMALRVARRSPSVDKALVATCVANASQQNFHGPERESQAQWLVDLNLELREIVMGRIAAMAFDFSFHRQQQSTASTTGTTTTASSSMNTSAFADRVVMDMFCSVLAANAVSSGPSAVGPFVTEWIIPSSRTLPSFAVVSVVSHLASEGLRKSAPYGTKDLLQQLSLPVMNIVLVPALKEAVSGNETNEAVNGCMSRERSTQLASVTLNAIRMWCEATDLSLPQMKHLCSKVNVNVIEVISDAMYSDSQQIIESLADLIESTVQFSDDLVMSPGRMSQVRHILQVDESSFQAQFTPQQLKTIESHEMASIVDELVSAVGLQRFRFTERQINGDFDACRNLSRIAATICNAWIDVNAQNGQSPQQPEPGIVSLLMKGAGHPSVNICALCLQVLVRVMPLVSSLSLELLPILQRRAITPHHITEGTIRLDASDVSGVNFHEFQNFRATVLSDALIVCWRGCGKHYMDSCSSAVEEFCSLSSSVSVSLQLEAALFCLEQIARAASDSLGQFEHHEQMRRLFVVLPTQPPSLMANPLTREGMCRFLRKYSSWCLENDRLGIAVELAMSSFRTSISDDMSKNIFRESISDISQSCVYEASQTLQELLCISPSYFVNEIALSKIAGLWEAIYTIVDHSATTIHVDDRVRFSVGLGRVLATQPDDQLLMSYLERVMSFPIFRLERLIQLSKRAQTSKLLGPLLADIGAELHIVTALSVSFSGTPHSIGMKSPLPVLKSRPDVTLRLIQRAWPSIMDVARNWTDNETVMMSLKDFLKDVLPHTSDDIHSVSLLHELCSLSSTAILTDSDRCRERVEVAFGFASDVLRAFGSRLDSSYFSQRNGSYDQSAKSDDVNTLVGDLIRVDVVVIAEAFGSAFPPKGLRREQMNDEDVMEQEIQTARDSLPVTSIEPLSAIMSFLEMSLEYCPLFFIQLIPMNGKNHNVWEVLQQATDVSVSSLNNRDSDDVRSAMSFLKSMVKKSSASPHDRLKTFANASLTRIRADVIGRLVLGVCGRYEYGLISCAAELLFLLLQSAPPSETEAQLVASLRQTHFLLGDRARYVALALMLRVAASPGSPSPLSVLTAFFQDVWQLHQIEDTDALPTSDEVARFTIKFS